MAEDLKARLAAARAKIAELDARREAREEEQSLLAEVEAAERHAREAETLEKLVAEHGPIGKMLRVVDTDEGMIVVKRPFPQFYKRFVDEEKTDTTAIEKFARACIVFPDKERLGAIFDAQPAAIGRCANAACLLAGVRKGEITGK